MVSRWLADQEAKKGLAAAHAPGRAQRPAQPRGRRLWLHAGPAISAHVPQDEGGGRQLERRRGRGGAATCRNRGPAYNKLGSVRSRRRGARSSGKPAAQARAAPAPSPAARWSVLYWRGRKPWLLQAGRRGRRTLRAAPRPPDLKGCSRARCGALSGQKASQGHKVPECEAVARHARCVSHLMC